MARLSKYKDIVVLTGAGISAESGLKTFRDNHGLWEGYRVEEVATPEAFYHHPETVHRFYNARRSQLISEATPNAAHQALANAEKEFQGSFLLVTQNVDNLHEQAGSQNVKHMHGELLRVRCTHCHMESGWEDDLSGDTTCPSCSRKQGMRPDIVWFGETPYFMDEIHCALMQCDLFIAIGTSGNVYPAAGFVQTAKSSGAYTIELNLESTKNTFFDENLEGKAGILVPTLCRELLGSTCD